MKTKYTSARRSDGSALMLVMIMCAISLIIMAGVMNRTSTVSKLNYRNNKYTLCSTVAGAATEKVYARMAFDFQSYGLGVVTNNYKYGLYQTNIPSTNENTYWGNFVFSDGQGNKNRTYVGYLTNYAGVMPSQYTNLITQNAPIYRIVSNVTMPGSSDIVGTAQEDVLLSLVPITTYAIFYNGVLEFSSCATMAVTGCVHANDEICTGTSSALDFWGTVSSTKTVDSPNRGGVSFSLNQGTTFHGSPNPSFPVASVTVAMNMTNSHMIIDMPVTNDVSTILGQQREYNKAFILLIVTNQPAVGTNPPTSGVTLTLQTSTLGSLPGADSSKGIYSYVYTNLIATNYAPARYTNVVFTNYSTSLYTNSPVGLGTWLSLTNTFTDKREYQTNFYVTQIDVGAFATWLNTNAYIFGAKFKFTSQTPPTILYVADLRNQGTNRMAAVRLVNGRKLPNNSGLGFSVATPNPLYVKGHYNVTADDIHFAWKTNSTLTVNSTVPAALFCDSITILSSWFSDSASSNSVGTATQTNTVNAAIVTGNVPSTGTSATTFSGGVHNLMRLQEDWSSSTLTLNTSIVVLWASQTATNQFRNPIGFSPAPVNPYYKPPTRLWGFDLNFYDPAKQPPGVPTALVPIRFNWNVPPPNTINADIGNY